MTPNRYRQVVEVFLEAAQHKGQGRERFIDGICREDEDLRQEVEAMLAAEEQSDRFLEQTPDDVAADLVGGRGGSVVGQQLGDYQVIELIGAGGMGEVFLAQDTRLGRRAALKILPDEYTLDPVRLRRFEQEACAIAALNHPNIMTIYGIGQAGSRRFLATEFVEGRTLRAMMGAGPLPLERVLDIGVQAASALAAAHSTGLVHRDIKPENMIVRPDGLLKILDLAWPSDRSSHPYQLPSCRPGVSRIHQSRSWARPGTCPRSRHEGLPWTLERTSSVSAACCTKC
ncbi:MAG: serine/threonine-protein kinase [Bryobacteraceae bacterium]